MTPAEGHDAPVGADQLDTLATLFDRAVELEPAARDAFLAEIPDSGVRRRMRQLLDGDVRWAATEPRWRERIGQVALALDGYLPRTIGACRILRRLGGGGMGDVYEAEEDGPIRRRVAVKVIRAGLESADAQLRFQNEIQAMARMEHPDIARVFRAGVHEGRPYLVMELVGGEPLNDYLRHQALDLGERLRLFARICRAVQHAHQKGVVHRDLKPSNVLVESIDGGLVPRLIDFGLAKATAGTLAETGPITDDGTAPGTAHFMSPEQARGGVQRADTRSDVYSLGAVLFWLLTGRFPFAAPTEEISRDQVLRRIRDGDPPRPSAIVARYGAPAGLTPRPLATCLAQELDWVVLRALERDADRRYASASELAADVERFLRDEPVGASRPTFAYRLRRSVRRHRLAVTLGASLLVVLVLGLGGLVLGVRASRRAERTTRVQLYESLLGQARDASGPLAVGQQERLLEDMAQAAALHGGLGRPPAELRVLRSAAMLALAQPDLRILRDWEGYPDGSRGLHADRSMTRYARGDERGDVTIRDVASDAELLRLPGFGKSVWHLEFGPDGDHLLVVYSELHVGRPEREVRLWHLPSRTVRLSARGSAIADAFRGDGRRVVLTLADGSIAVHRVDNGAVARRVAVPAGAAPRVARFAGGTDSLLVWEPGGSWFELEGARTTVGAPVWDVATDGRGRHVAVGGDNRLQLIDRAAAGVRREIMDAFSRVTLAAFRPAGGVLGTSGWDATLRIWDVPTGRELLRHSGVLVRFDDRGNRLLLRVGTRVVLVGWHDSEIVRTISPGSPGARPHLLRVHPAYPFAVTVGGGQVRAWDLEAGREVPAPPGPATAAAFGPAGGDLLLGRAGLVSAWRVSRVAGRWDLARADSIQMPEALSPIWLASEPSDRLVVAVDGPTGNVSVFERGSTSGAVATIPSHANTIWGELSRDGRTVVTGPWNAPGIVAWSARTGEFEAVLPGSELATRGTIAFSPDGRWLAGYTDRPHGVCVWHPAGWNPGACRRHNHPSGRPGILAFSPDSRLIAAADPVLGRVRLLDVDAALEEVAVLELSSALGINGIQFTGDGRYLALVDASHRVHVVDMRELKGRLNGMGLDWSPVIE